MLVAAACAWLRPLQGHRRASSPRISVRGRGGHIQDAGRQQ